MHSEIVGLLLKKGADVKYEGEKNEELRPLHLPLEKGTYNSHFEIVKLLLAEWCSCQVLSQGTSLHWSIYRLDLCIG
jgi:hypothetical protein